MDQQTERAHLRKAEADIASAREHIKRQEALLARLEDLDHNKEAEVARSVLQTMRQTLRVMEEHRQIILDQLSDMKARPW